MGLFQTLIFQKSKLGPLKIYYLEYTGDYYKLGPFFQVVFRDTQPYFKFPRYFALYYDDRSKTLDKKKTRAIIGVILNNGESIQKEQEFEKAHINYRKSELPLAEGIFTRFPYRNVLTYYLCFKKIHRSINDYWRKIHGGEASEDSKIGIMHIYYINRCNSFIEFWIPYGPNAEKYQLSTSPKPISKEHDE